MMSKQRICIGTFTFLIMLPSLYVSAANKPQRTTNDRPTSNIQRTTTVRPPPDYAITSVTVKRSGGKIFASAVMEISGTGEIPGTQVCTEAYAFKNKKGRKCGSSNQLLEIMQDTYPSEPVTVYGRAAFPSGRGDLNSGNNALKVILYPNQQQATQSR